MFGASNGVDVDAKLVSANALRLIGDGWPKEVKASRMLINRDVERIAFRCGVDV